MQARGLAWGRSSFQATALGLALGLARGWMNLHQAPALGLARGRMSLQQVLVPDLELGRARSSFQRLVLALELDPSSLLYPKLALDWDPKPGRVWLGRHPPHCLLS